ncbi:MAG: membrane dipeptidase [Gemmatimonadales bacterium]
MTRSVDRRAFVGALAAVPLAGRLVRTAGRSTAQTGPDRLVIDAMGELRFEYPPELIRAMIVSGLDAITVTLCDPKPEGDEALVLALDSLLAHDRFIAANPDLLLRGTRADDIELARRTGRLAVFYLYQNTVQFGTDLDRIDLFHRLGLRSCQLTYNTRNHVGVGCWEEGGLTDFGRETIERMNARRMLVDLSHANLTTMADAIAASRAPVIISHTACMAVYQNRRNTSDAVLRALADRGGVVGICQMRPFLTPKKTDNLAAYFDHLLHAIRVAGAELKREEGSQVQDNELPYFIAELNGPRRMEVVWDGLVKRGLPEREVELVMGGNVRRLYREVIG